MIPPSTTITEEGRRIRRILWWVVLLVIGLNVVVWVAARLSSGGGVTGPAGSSYVTTRSGAAALEGSLGRLGESTRRLRSPLDEVGLPPDGTLVMIDVAGSEYSTAELDALDGFLREGGRVLVAGQAAMVERLLADPPTWRPEGSERGRVAGDILGPAQIGSVPLSGFGSLEPGPDDTPFLVGDDETVIGAHRAVGEGTLLWLADSHPLHNEGLGAESAALAVMAMIDPVGPVMFDEYRHGYTDEGGVWSVIPTRWRLALILGAAATAVALIGYGRRFGPPYDTHRRLAPGRSAYLEAVSGIMARSGDRTEALSIIREEARRLLAERSAGDSPEHAALSAGLSASQAHALLEEEASDETLVAAGRALATLREERRWR